MIGDNEFLIVSYSFQVIIFTFLNVFCFRLWSLVTLRNILISLQFAIIYTFLVVLTNTFFYLHDSSWILNIIKTFNLDFFNGIDFPCPWTYIPHWALCLLSLGGLLLFVALHFSVFVLFVPFPVTVIEVESVPAMLVMSADPMF